MFYLREIERGKQGLGEYKLHPQFSSLLDMLPLLLPEANKYHPKSIVDHIKCNLTHSDHETNKDPTPVTSNLTQIQRARCAIENNRISFDPRLHTFTIVGSTKPHAVIMAAKLSIGQDDKITPKNKINLSQLRKNARSRKDKTSGRKRP